MIIGTGLWAGSVLKEAGRAAAALSHRELTAAHAVNCETGPQGPGFRPCWAFFIARSDYT